MLKYQLAHVSGPIIKKLRKEKRMTQTELAILMNVSRSVVANWESQMRAPTTDQFCRLAGIFNVTADYLVGRGWDKDADGMSDDIDIDISKLNRSGKLVIRKVYETLITDKTFTKNSAN